MSKIALVTGASSGIGQAIAIRLARDGYTLVIQYNTNKSGAEKTLTEVLNFSPGSMILQFDITDFLQVEKALKDLEKVDVLVNNAGIHADSFAALMSNEDFEKVIHTNLNGTFYVTKCCIKKMLLRRSGCIVNISSLSGQIGNIGQINYSASKAGLIAFTKTLSAELGSRGIRVNAVAPGIIETEMIQNIPFLEELKKKIPMARFGKASEVAGVVSFLCSEDASYVQGHTISVNGGLLPS